MIRKKTIKMDGFTIKILKDEFPGKTIVAVQVRDDAKETIMGEAFFHKLKEETL